MDLGHYNCRDYYISPHFAATTISSDRERPRVQQTSTGGGVRLDHILRHESFEELEQRSRSPASLKPKFPLLRLPLEIRQQILSYLLPRTIEQPPPNPLTDHARTFGAVQKRAAKGMPLPVATGETSYPTATSSSSSNSSPRAIVWQRGNVKLLSVCRQLHEECADLLYGGQNTFLLFVTYAGIVFRFSWLLASGLSPQRRYPFLELLPPRYLARLKRLSINIEHVDGYTGMIKFNVSEQGLVQGLRKQVHRLVVALLTTPVSIEAAGTTQDEAVERVTEQDSAYHARESLAKVHIRVSTSSSVIDELKRLRQGGGEPPSTVVKDLEHMLAPLEDLSGVREAAVTGAVTPALAARLCQSMTRERDETAGPMLRKPPSVENLAPLLCVYGNDI